MKNIFLIFAYISFVIHSMQVGLVAPNYVRSVTLTNKTGANVSVEVGFKSGEKGQFTIGKDPVVIERDIDHGDYSTVDPVLDFKVNYGQGESTNISCLDAQSIEVRKYVIHENKTLERVTA